MNLNDRHLTQDQLIMAVIDENDLGHSFIDHITNCPDCRAKIQNLKQRLNKLGKLARETAPTPQKKPIPHRKTGWTYLFPRPVIAAAVTAILLVLVIVWPWNQKEIYQFNTAKIIQEMEKDEQFMADIEELETFALSGLYMDANGTGNGMIDDEFIDFLIPLENGSFI